MKLLNCMECHDVQAMTFTERTCFCGKSKGKYVNEVKVEVSGPSRVIGMRNDDYFASMRTRDPRRNYNWFEIIEKDQSRNCESYDGISFIVS